MKNGRHLTILKKLFGFPTVVHMEAPPGFEPGNRGFAGPCLTAWLWRQYTMKQMERETRFELATPALARQCSTTELFPQGATEHVENYTILRQKSQQPFKYGAGDGNRTQVNAPWRLEKFIVCRNSCRSFP